MLQGGLKEVKNPFRTLLDPSLQRLARYMLPYKKQLVLAVIAMLAAASGSSLIALLLGKLTDAGFYNQSPEIIFAAPVALIFVAALNGGGMFFSNYILSRVSQSMLVTLRKELFHNMLHWPEEVRKKNPSGIISSKFLIEGNVALSGATKSAIVLVRDSVQVVSLIFVLIWHNWLLTLVCLIMAPAVVFLLRTISRRIRSVMASSQQNIATLLARVKESYESDRLIKISGTYDFELSRFHDVNQIVRDLVLRITKISSFGDPLTQLIGMAGVAVVLVVALLQTQRGDLSFGGFVTFLTAMLLLLPPLRRLAGLNSALVGMSVAAQSLFGSIDEPLEMDKGKFQAEYLSGAVEFKNVSLRYPNADRDSVKNFTLKVEAGKSIAFVGLSGAGKSSVVNMIPRLVNPTSGEILMDGIDTREFTLASLRRQISWVSQDIVIFDGTLRSNIAYGSPSASEEDIRRAADAAALGDFISSLPEGLDTPVGEGGGRLSGGQKQRVSIARAFLKNAPILIFDEATSALDSESEEKIRLSLEQLMKNRTTFMVAHRLSSIRNADKIVVMENGQIIEEGTHEELIARGGRYASLTNLQSLGEFA